MNADERRFNTSEQIQIKAPPAPRSLCGAVGLMMRGGGEKEGFEGGWNDNATVKAFFELLQNLYLTLNNITKYEC